MDFNDTMQNDGLYVYLNTWTRSNDTLTNEYIEKYMNLSRVSVLYSYNNFIPICLTTRGMPWQDLQRWTLQNCTTNDTNLVLQAQAPVTITIETYPFKTL